jgi:hypothetical protein
LTSHGFLHHLCNLSFSYFSKSLLLVNFHLLIFCFQLMGLRVLLLFY